MLLYLIHLALIASVISKYFTLPLKINWLYQFISGSCQNNRLILASDNSDSNDNEHSKHKVCLSKISDKITDLKVNIIMFISSGYNDLKDFRWNIDYMMDYLDTVADSK